MQRYEGTHALCSLLAPQAPSPSKCEYVSVAPDAARAFSDFNLEHEFADRRLALLYGRWVDPPPASGEKRGVQVDIVYVRALAESRSRSQQPACALSPTRALCVCCLVAGAGTGRRCELDGARRE